MGFKKTFWYKRELYNIDSETTTSIVTGIVSVPFWWTPIRVYLDLRKACDTEILIDIGSTWVITDFKRI